MISTNELQAPRGPQPAAHLDPQRQRPPPPHCRSPSSAPICHRATTTTTLVTATLILLLCHLQPPSVHGLLQGHHHRTAKLTNPGQCHASWYNVAQKCYKVTHTPRNLESSKTRCGELSAELVTVEDEQSQQSTRKEEEDDSPGTSASTTTNSPPPPPPPPPPHSSTNYTSLNDLSMLFSQISTDLKNRFFYVNIGPNMMRQYKMFYESKLTNGDLSEPADSELIMPDWWIPRDEPALNHTMYLPDTQANPTEGSAPGFVLTKFREKWALMPMLPTRKASSLCEMPARANDQRHHQRTNSAPRNNQQHQIMDPKRSPTEANHQVLSPTSSLASLPEARRNPEKEVAIQTTTPQPPVPPSPPQPEVVSSALFRDIPQNQSIVMGSTSEMRCSPIDHDSSLYWTVNGKNLTQSNRIKLHASGTLRIEHVRNTEGGNYTCTISSGGMSESRSAWLEIIERPYQPEYIQAELLDRLSTSVRIRWTPGFNGNSPITKYLVEMRTVNSDNIDTELGPIMQSNQWEIAKANISADQTSVIIPDLKPARKYIFRIKAANRIGTSDASMPTRPPIEVPVQPPSMAPERLAGTPRSSTSISLQWLPPPQDSQNGVIKAYKIRHKLAGYASEADWHTVDVSEPGHLSYILDDLITWQNYEIQIAAVNDKGVGPFSSSEFVRTKEGRPDEGPGNVLAAAITSKVIKVTWNPPRPQHVNGINQGYKVQVWYDPAHTELAKELVVAHNSLTPLQATTVDELAPYTDYHITIKCFTSAGDGVANEEEVVVKTKQDLPEAVQSVEFADVLDKSLRLVWRPPVKANGELTQYTVEYWMSSAEKKISKTFPSSINEARIVDLIPETSYTFRVYPHTEVGQGPARTNQTETSKPPVLPEAPSNLHAVQVGPYSATIQFQAGFDGNAAIEKWIAEALTPSNGDYKPRWQVVYESTNHSHGNSVVVRNLRPFTRYKIRLTPVNIAGPSKYPSATTEEFQTSQIEPEQAPKDLTIEEVKSTSALARWSPLSHTNWSGRPLGYNLTWVEAGNSTVNHQMINDMRADSFPVRDLEEFTEYTFKIHAVNDAGPSASSEPVVITTLEDVPSSGPTNLTARALTSNTVSVDWNSVPKRHRNGIIKGYKIQYQAQKLNVPLQYKSVEDNNTKHVILNDLKPFTTYHLAVAAFTSVGDGVYGPIIQVQTLEDTPGLPQNVSSPTVSQNTARILWDPPEDANGDILGYKVSYYALSEGTNGNGNGNNNNNPNGSNNNKDVASHELQSNERTFKATNLKPDTHYVFTVTAKTKEGWGQQASTLVYTYDSEMRANLPFYREGWFVILCACLSVVITITVTALLFIQTKSYKYKQDAIKSTSQDRLGDAGFTIDDDPGSHYNNGFGLLANGASNHRRSNGALSQSTANVTLPKTPPRPHPGSVVYSDDDGDDDVFEDNHLDKPSTHRHHVRSVAGTSHYDSSADSITEKPSEISSSPAPESESADDEYVNMANRHFVNHYANVNGTLRSQRSWKKNGGPTATTSKHYASSSAHRTKPKLPQRPAPSVPQVPIDHSQSSSDNGQPIAGSSGMQHHMNGGASRMSNGGSSIYGDSQTLSATSQLDHHHNNRPSSSNQVNGHSGDSNETYPKMEQLQQHENTHYNKSQQQQQQQIDLLNNNHLVSLNGGRIIVDNMAGSRAPLPGFTSFV